MFRRHGECCLAETRRFGRIFYFSAVQYFNQIAILYHDPKRSDFSRNQSSQGIPCGCSYGSTAVGKDNSVTRAVCGQTLRYLEDPDQLDFALSDPRGFLKQFAKGAVLDEIQWAPKLFSYIQGIVDKQRKPGLFILTGSQHFGLLAQISQTLAGRVATLELLPFSSHELKAAGQHHFSRSPALSRAISCSVRPST
jgi:hypothetical protein